MIAKRYLYFSFVVMFALLSAEPVIGTDSGRHTKVVYKVAVDREYAPYEFVDPDREVKGFTPDLLREIVKLKGVSFSFIPVDWPDAIAGLGVGSMELINLLNSGLQQVKETGRYEEIVDKWFALGVPENNWILRNIYLIAGLLGALTVVLTGFVVWNIMLRRSVEIRNRALRDSRDSLNEAQRIAGLGSWEWDIDSNVLNWSEETFRIFGIDKNRFGADFKTFISAVYADDRERVQSSINNAVRDGVQKWEIDYRILLPGDELRYLHEEARQVFSSDGRVVKRLGIVKDVTERKLAEEELLKSEERYRLVFENSPVSIWEEDFSEVKRFFDGLRGKGISDIETYFDQHPESVRYCAEIAKIIDVNEAALDLHGARSKEELCADLVKTFTPESFKTFRKALVSVWNGGTKMIEDAVVKTMAGEPRHVTLYFSVCPGYAESLSRVIVSIIDLTEQKRIQEQVLMSNQRLRLHQEQSPLGFLEWDVNFRAIEWNTACERIFGYTREEVIGRHAKDLILPEEVHDLVDGIYQSLMNKRGGQHSINRNVTKDGRTIICEWFNTTLVDKDGNAIGVASVCKEITKQKQDEEKLHSAYEYIQQIVDAANVMIIGLDLSGNVKMLNKAAEKITGYSVSELSNINWFEKIVPRDRYEYVWEVFEGFQKKSGSMPTDFENPILTKSGEERFIAWKNSPIISTEGEIVTISFGIDITERKSAEDKLKENQRLLLEAQQMAHIGNWWHDMITGEIYWSDEFFRILGIEPQKPTKELVASLFHPDDFPILHKAMEESAAGKSEHEHDFRIIRPDGEIRWIHNHWVRIDDENGREIRRIGTHQDITERKKAEQERVESLKFFKGIDLVNRAIEKAEDIESMMRDVLDAVLVILDCDRAYLLYPCDPEALSWMVPVERTRPEYPGVLALNKEIPMERGVSDTLRLLLDAAKPVKFGPGTGNPLPEGVAERFTIECFMAMSIYPKNDKPWQFGIHQCSHVRQWTLAEEKLFEAIGYRLTDGLTSKRVYEELRSSEEKYRRIVDTANEGIWVLGPDTRTTFVNMQMIEMLGYSGEEMIGKELSDFMFKEDWEDNLREMGNRRQGMSEHYERRFRHRNGKSVWTRVSAVPVMDSDGNFQGSFGMLTDISDRKAVEQELYRLNLELEKRVTERTAELQMKSEELLDSQNALVNIVEDLNEKTLALEAANEKLKDLDRLKSLFIASMSHELRTPLNSIIGFTGIILQGLSGEINPDQRDQLQRVLRSGKHLLNLINDVIDISKIEAGKVDTIIELFYLREVIDEILASVESQINNKELALDVNVSHDVLMRTDKVRIHQCLLNFISNAIKYTEKGGITVSVDEINGKVKIKVADSGIGIKEEDLSKLFQSFVRIDSPLRFKTLGTGLGLYLTKKIAREVLKGTVSVKSVYGQGSTFELEVPRELEVNRDEAKILE